MTKDANRVPKRITDMLLDITGHVADIPNVSRMVLYGSYAKGTYTEESDVDLAVFFTGDDCRLLEEYRKLVRICQMERELDIQIQAFLEKELEVPCGIIEEIVAYGIEIPLIGVPAE